MNQKSPIVTSAKISDRNVGTTKRDWFKGGNPEDDKNIAKSPPQKKEKLKKTDRNIRNRSKSEVLHKETVVLHMRQ